ncbi:DUF1543 domain-containing protein [Kaistella rhinocerotis]|uniref:DUF1543 domain-containing protein n=1 Tax=Kaistella rhinocerotis TaxID=3026437 RepID=UPI0025571C29|nr:DUF1543 domain-containing protein [Kaistella sp. Ran72]
MKLFYLNLGATPAGRNIEQHDVFFGIAESLRDLVPQIKDFWPEANGEIHIDAWQQVNAVDGFTVNVVPKTEISPEQHLFFLNLGGYKPGLFAELHEQHLMVGTSMPEIIKRVKQTEFYKTMGFKNAESHIDDKYGVDIDDIFRVEDILPAEMKEKYSIVLEETDATLSANPMKVGYFKLSKL